MLEKSPIAVTRSSCECKAGSSGKCSHVLGLLYTVCHFIKLNCKCVPLITSKTSLPQQWHIPQRTDGLESKSTDKLAISKVKAEKSVKTRERVIEGILPTVYCPVQQPIPFNSFSQQLFSNLCSIGSDAQILKLLPSPDNQSNIPLINSVYGSVPFGSPIGYHHPVDDFPRNFENITDAPPYPEFPMPEQTGYSTVLCNSMSDLFDGLYVDRKMSLDIERETVLQSKSKLWKSLRCERLTSSFFKDICSRKGDYDSLALRLSNSKSVQTSAMQHGLMFEPSAAKNYADITGNNIYACGFVINPNAPHLGTSPDRKVYDQNSDKHFGLLEIKCPVADSYVECKYLKQIDGKYSLKKSHSYYYQIIGQLGLTGMTWCDFFVNTQNDYFLERIEFDVEFWNAMKCKLDTFFFEFYLPCILKNRQK